MNYDSLSNLQIDFLGTQDKKLYIEGRYYSVEDLIAHMVCNKREDFWNILTTTSEGSVNSYHTFDSIGFKAFTADFNTPFILDQANYEGTIMYDVTAGHDWIWHCKTELTWKSSLPEAFGRIHYHTTIVENENIKNYRIQAMTGTSMEVRIVKNNLKFIPVNVALERSKAVI